MFREYRPHNCGLSLRVNHSAGLNCLPCLIEGSDQSMDLIRVKRLGVPCEKCAHSLPTGDGKKVAQSLARGNGIRVFHVIASSGALQKSEERSRATTGSPKSRRLGLCVSSPKEDAMMKIAFVLAAAAAVLTTAPPATPAKAQDLKMAQGVNVEIGRDRYDRSDRYDRDRRRDDATVGI